MMKTRTPLSGGLVLLLALLIYVPARAQGPVPKQGIAPASTEALCYQILDLHGLNDHHASMELLGALDIGAAEVPPEFREDLAWARIDGLFYFRKFEEIFPAIEAFRSAYPASGRLDAVAEYELAARFERGQKKIIEAAQLKGEKAAQRRVEGGTDLTSFLLLAASHPAGDYAVLSSRSLQDDRWTARVILGEKAAILEEVSAGGGADGERFHLLCALLYPKIQPEKADENLKVMADFREAFPESESWPRVELEMAGVALREGERLAMTSGSAEAKSYLDFTREWFGRVVADDDAGIEVEGIAEADVWDAREGMMRACFWQKDDGQLADWTEGALSIAEPGDKRWRQAKLFDALALIRQSRFAQADPLLGDVADLGFTGQPGNDGVTLEAVRWLAFIALREDKPGAIRKLVRDVRNSECVENIKKPFVKEYAWVE